MPSLSKLELNFSVDLTDNQTIAKQIDYVYFYRQSVFAYVYAMKTSDETKNALFELHDSVVFTFFPMHCLPKMYVFFVFLAEYMYGFLMFFCAYF